MAIDFPASPTPGQVFQGYYWDSAKLAWRSETPSVGAVVTSTTTPTGAKNGDLWYNTNDGTLYVYFDNGITAYWTEIKANSALTTTLSATKANLAGGNAFTGNQTITSGNVFRPDAPGFLAYHQASDLTYAVGATLAYPYTVYNVGNAYNTTTSTFTAPVAGRYLFSINANGSRDTGVGGVPRAYWKINGSNVGNGIHLRGSDATGNGLEQRSQTVVFNLAVNDTVKVVVGENRWDIFGANFFMGYLIG